jgi:hypothetical protein
MFERGGGQPKGEGRERGMSEARLRAGESSRMRGKEESLCPYQASIQGRRRLFCTYKRRAIREGRTSHFSGFARHGTAPKHQTLNRLGSWTTSGVGFEGESSDAHSGDSPCSRSVRVKVALSWVSVEVSSGGILRLFPAKRKSRVPLGG